MRDIHSHGMAYVEKGQVLLHGDAVQDDALQYLLDHDEAMVQVLEVVLFCLWQLHHDDVHEHAELVHGRVCRDYCIRNHELHLHTHLYVHI